MKTKPVLVPIYLNSYIQNYFDLITNQLLKLQY